MKTKRFQLVILLVTVSLLASACGSQAPAATAIPTNTDTAVPPTATPTDTAVPATPTATPLPPTPTTPAVPASTSPVTVGAFQISFETVTVSDSGYNGFVPASLAAGQTVLTVQVKLDKGDLSALSQLSVSVVDDSGARTQSGTTLSVDAKSEVIWLIPVAKTAHSYTLYFPSGEAFDLSPLIH